MICSGTVSVSSPPPSVAIWPTSTGDAAFLIRDRDWSKTPLGPVADWPQSLKNTVENALSCGFPTIALWSRDLVQLYNDAYRCIMGDKHPEGMGQATRDCWPEVWEFNQPIYNRVLQGEQLTFADQLFPINRHGYLEQAYFALCYSPLRDEQAVVRGVLVTAFETTERFKAEAACRASEARLIELFRQAPVFFALLRGPEHVFEMINPRFQELIGLREVLGRPVSEAVPEAAAQGFTKILDTVYRTSEPYTTQGARFEIARRPGEPLGAC